MLIRITVFTVILLLVLSTGGTFLLSEAQDPFPYSVTRHKLNNGLTVILSEDHSLPVVSVVIAYHVGSIQDRPDKYGLAYILENLMFQGSRNIGRMQHVNFITRVGGEFNALTSYDRTIFQQTLPSNQLALVLWLESDRMKSLMITPQKVELAKRMIQTDIQRRKALDPYLESSLHFDRLLYPDEIHSHPIFGLESSLPNITTQDVWDFYQTYYTPSNAVLCITGHFQKEKTLNLVEKYFKTIQNRPGEDVPSPSFMLPEEEVVDSRSESVPDPCFFLGFRLVDLFPSDRYALKHIEYNLAKGEGSRLYKRLVLRERLASYVEGRLEKRGDQNTFRLFITINSEQVRERCQRILNSEINRIRTALIQESEYLRAKNMIKSDILAQFLPHSKRALFLVEFFLDRGQVERIGYEISRFMGIGRNDVMGVAGRHLTPRRFQMDVQVK